MSRYRKVDSRIWNDAKFMGLSDHGKLVFFMLLTHPNMTALGAMRATLAGLSEEIGWSTKVFPKAFQEAFREVRQKGMVEHDQKACFIALPNFLRYNPPESPNVIKAWSKSLDLLPECDLKNRVIAAARDFVEGMGKGFRQSLGEAFRKSMPYQEQEQEQEQEVPPMSPKGAQKGKVAKSRELDRYPQELHLAIQEWRLLLRALKSPEVLDRYPEDKRFLAGSTGTAEATWKAWEKHLGATVQGVKVTNQDVLAAVRIWAAEKLRRAQEGISLSGPMLPSLINHADFVDAVIRTVKARTAQGKEGTDAS